MKILFNCSLILCLPILVGCAQGIMKGKIDKSREYSPSTTEIILKQATKYSNLIEGHAALGNHDQKKIVLGDIKKFFCNCYNKYKNKCFSEKQSSDIGDLWFKSNAAEIVLKTYLGDLGADPDAC